MTNNFKIESVSKLQEQIELLDVFLSEYYDFRHNVLSNTYEMRELGEELQPFRPVTREARNTLIRRFIATGIEVPNLGQHIDEYIYSEDTPIYDPAYDWLISLPQWDGKNHVGELFGRLPGINTEQHHFLAIWMRSVVAHWLGMDMLHGNESVVTLIGKQGCGKSTFCANILPPHLRSYYLDHINLGNKNDKEMALTNNLLVNLDELDQIKPGQHAELKQTLSKIMVNGRPIYGRAQKCRKRYASFVSTTNNPRPLCDPTGSRRYLCINIPEGQFIDNATPIDHEQLYAQVLHELQTEQMRHWFTNEETQRIEQINQEFQHNISLEDMVDCCFRHPRKNEIVHPIPLKQIIATLTAEFPTLKTPSSFSICLGKLLKEQNFEHKHSAKGSIYFIVPKKAS